MKQILLIGVIFAQIGCATNRTISAECASESLFGLGCVDRSETPEVEQVETENGDKIASTVFSIVLGVLKLGVIGL